MLEAALRSGASSTAHGVRGVRPATARRAAIRGGRGDRPRAGRRWSASASPTRISPSSGTTRWSTHPPWSFSPATGSPETCTAIAEGECYFPGSPIMTVEGTFAEAVLLETVILSILNHDCAIATAASRMINAAGSRPLIEMGSRRTHEMSAVAAARAAYLCRILRHLQPHGRTRVRRADRRDRGPRLHPAARLREAGLPGPDRLARRRHHAARGHLRRGAGRTDRGGAGRAPTWAPSASTPATWPRSPTRSANSSTRWAPTRPGSSSPATWTSTPSRRWPPRPWTATASAPRWSPAPASPTAALVYKLVAREDDDGVIQPVAKKSVGKPSRGGRKEAFRELDADGHGGRRAGHRLRRPARGCPPAPGPAGHGRRDHRQGGAGRVIRGRHRDASPSFPATTPTSYPGATPPSRPCLTSGTCATALIIVTSRTTSARAAAWPSAAAPRWPPPSPCTRPHTTTTTSWPPGTTTSTPAPTSPPTPTT